MGAGRPARPRPEPLWISTVEGRQARGQGQEKVPIVTKCDWGGLADTSAHHISPGGTLPTVGDSVPYQAEEATQARLGVDDTLGPAGQQLPGLSSLQATQPPGCRPLRPADCVGCSEKPPRSLPHLGLSPAPVLASWPQRPQTALKGQQPLGVPVSVRT